MSLLARLRARCFNLVDWPEAPRPPRLEGIDVLLAPLDKPVEWEGLLPFPAYIMPRGGPMPQRFEALAAYNAEVSRGIVHTAVYDEQMAVLQVAFDVWQRETLFTPPPGAYSTGAGYSHD